MAWDTIHTTPDDLASEITTFAGGVTSIDNIYLTSQSGQQVVALIDYTA